MTIPYPAARSGYRKTPPRRRAHARAARLGRAPGKGTPYTESEILAEIRRVAGRVRGHFSLTKFLAQSALSCTPIYKRFGNWRAALLAAGLARRLAPRAMGAKHTWEECFQNLDRMVRLLARAPLRYEMNAPPSRIGAGTYLHRFATWRNALAAYAAYQAGDEKAWPMPGTRRGKRQRALSAGRAARAALIVRRRASQSDAEASIPLQLRYDVLKRDRFRCTACGANPAADGSVILTLDHKVPRAHGGKTEKANLATLCLQCNLGRGAMG